MKISCSILFVLLLVQSVKSQKLIIQSGHYGNIKYTQFINDNTKVLSAGEDGKVVIWDIETSLQENSLSVYNEAITACHWNDKTRQLAVGSELGYLKIYYFNLSLDTPQVYEKYDGKVDKLMFSKSGRFLAFSTNNHQMVFLNDSFRETLNFSSRILQFKFDEFGKRWFIGLANGEIYTYNFLQRQNFIDVGHAINAIDFSFETNRMVLTTMAHSSSLKIYNLKRKKLVQEVEAKGRVSKLSFGDQKELYFSNYKGGLYSLRPSDKKPTMIVEKMEEAFSVSSHGKQFATSSLEQLHIIYLRDPNHVHPLKGNIRKPIDILGASGDSLIVEYQDGIKIWNLRTLKLEVLKEKFYDKDWRHNGFSKDLSFWLQGGLLYENGDWSSMFNYNKVKLSAFDKDNSKVAILDSTGAFQVFDLDSAGLGMYQYSLKSIAFIKFDSAESQRISFIQFSEDGCEIIINGINNYILDLNTLVYRNFAPYYRETEVVLPSLIHPKQEEYWIAGTVKRKDSIPFDASDGWLSIKQIDTLGKVYYENILSGIILVYDSKSLDYKSYLFNNINTKFKRNEIASILHCATLDKIFIFYTDNNVAVVDESDTLYNEWNVKTMPCFGIKKAFLSSDESFVFIETTEGGILMVDPITMKPICTFYVTLDGEYFVLNELNYYKRSKNISNAVAVNKEGVLSRIGAYDPFYNRPHELMKSIGLANRNKINAIEKLVKSDLQNSPQNSQKGTLPTLEILNTESINYSTSEEYIELNIKSSAVNYLKELKVWINGVPLFKSEFVIEGKKQNSLNKSFLVPLMRGENRIKLQVIDQSGQWSQDKFLQINCSKPFVKPDLHLIVLSVSNYQNAQYNLKYAVKDGRDFVSTFIDSKGEKRLGFPSRFNKIYLDTLYDEQATKVNYLSLFEKLKSTKPEDYVYIYVSGHGLLDTSLNFYFATFDVDFDDPAHNGLSFSKIEEIFNGVPARQRLILMDACHSGEVLDVEKEEGKQVALPSGAKGQIVGFNYKGTFVEEVGEEKVELNEIRQELFSNYSSTSGATVISAASGNSYALESDEWNNGIFTYSVITGLIHRLADLNNDGDVSVNELSKFVFREVKEKTNGRQIPNDRQENIENNFRIW